MEKTVIKTGVTVDEATVITRIAAFHQPDNQCTKHKTA